MKGQELDGDTIVNIVGDYVTGAPVEKIAEDFGVGTGTVSRWTNRLPGEVKYYREIAITLRKLHITPREGFVHVNLVLSHPDYSEEELTESAIKLIEIEKSEGEPCDIALSKIETKLSDSKGELNVAESKLQSVQRRIQEAEGQLSEKERVTSKLDSEIPEKKEYVESKKKELENELSDALSKHKTTIENVGLVRKVVDEEFKGSPGDFERLKRNLEACGSLIKALDELRPMKSSLEDSVKKLELRRDGLNSGNQDNGFKRKSTWQC